MVKNFPPLLFILLCGSQIFFSCASYKQNIMFSVPENRGAARLASAAEKNYVIQPNDLISLDVFTNSGERIIDPDKKLSKDGSSEASQGESSPKYLVDVTGKVRLPLLGEMKLDGFTLRDAETLLQKEYGRFYLEPFVRISFQNKRVIILGAPGGQVIPLTNEKVTLVEVLALARGVNNDAKANNIRIIRGDQVMVADLSTFDGYTKSNIVMESGDIVYVEPIRRPFLESFRDVAPILGLAVSIATLALILGQ